MFLDRAGMGQGRDFLDTEKVAAFDRNVATSVTACTGPGVHLLSLG
jgi:hypothetical protein